MTELLWTERYRPHSIKECILPNDIDDIFTKIVIGGSLPNLLLSGSAGVGKTTVAKALCAELGCDSLVVNGSMDGNIDTLRTKILRFVSTCSFTGNKKVVILDEADYINPQSTQPALRAFMEEYSENCRFILTCNYKNRIIPALQSRCSCVDFKIDKSEVTSIASQFLKRIIYILKEEKISCEKRPIIELIKKHFPDFRRIINELQKYAVHGKIDEGILTQVTDVRNVRELLTAMRAKKFHDVRKWVTSNLDNDPSKTYKAIYDDMYQALVPNTIPDAVVIIGTWQYRSAFAADQEINLMACLVELMGNVEFIQ